MSSVPPFARVVGRASATATYNVLWQLPATCAVVASALTSLTMPTDYRCLRPLARRNVGVMLTKRVSRYFRMGTNTAYTMRLFNHDYNSAN